jgi:pimeloyl-ACP methyl ester carboxylesterase
MIGDVTLAALGIEVLTVTVAQQARDAASVIRAMGDGKAVVVGGSRGAIIGLELATTMPEVIDFLIVYEAPVIEMLPMGDVEKWSSFVNNIFTKNQSEGSQAAQTAFMASLINVPDSPLPTDLNDRISRANIDFFFKHEFRAFFRSVSNIETIRKNNVQMVTAIGRDSDNAYYIQTTRALAAKLGCENVEFPGHHDVSFWMPKEFATAIQKMLERYGYNQE